MVFRGKLVFSAIFLGVQGARVRRQGTQHKIAGVPVHGPRDGADNWIVLFRSGTTDADITEFCDGSCLFRGNADAGGLPFARVNGRQRMEAAVRKRSVNVQLLEADTEIGLIPEVDVQVSSESSPPWGLERIGVPGRPTTGKGVHIYVTDTGVRTSHDDFGGRAVSAIDASFMKEGTDVSLKECAVHPEDCAVDRQGHGTHCAGTAAGRQYGVASDAFIHGVKTLGDGGGGYTGWQLAAIDWIIVKGERPAVLSMSLGAHGEDPAYNMALGLAAENGLTVVVAAGNFNIDSCNFSPAFSSMAITVGATEPNNRRAYYSNWGACNDIMAPGSSVLSASHEDDSGTLQMSGTSMACPHVSGAAALLLEANPSLYGEDILASMQSSARTGLIGGLVDGDPDVFLWVSGSTAPAPEPTTALPDTPEPTPAPTPPPALECIEGCTPDFCFYHRCGACSWC